MDGWMDEQKPSQEVVSITGGSQQGFTAEKPGQQLIFPLIITYYSKELNKGIKKKGYGILFRSTNSVPFPYQGFWGTSYSESWNQFLIFSPGIRANSL
jgi:hypothetical protein